VGRTDQDSPDLPPSPNALDRGALERVLARAAELGAVSSDARDTADAITEAQLLEIGKEVGLTPTALQQALAEERTRVVLPEETGRLAQIMGPGAVSATRVVPQSPEAVLAALEEWMRAEYRLIAKRRYGFRRTWEPKGGVFAELERGLRGNQSAAELMKATEVAATVSAVGDGRTVVRLDADLTGPRRARRSAAIALGAAGVAIGTVPVILGLVLAPVAMAPLFLALGAVPVLGFSAGGWATLKSHRERATRAQLGLEQLLDRLEHTALPRGADGSVPRLSDTVAAVANSMRDVARIVEETVAAQRRPR
jgi:hypothetical protein